MGKGTATASTPVICSTPAEIKAAVDGLTLAGANAGPAAGDNYDKIAIVPTNLGTHLVFKITHAAS